MSCLTVDVGSTASVVAWENGLKLHDTIAVAGLDTTEESGVKIGCVGRVAVSAGLDAGVDTLLKLELD